MVMMEVMVSLTHQMKMNDEWNEVEEWRWMDEKIKVPLGHAE